MEPISSMILMASLFGTIPLPASQIPNLLSDKKERSFSSSTTISSKIFDTTIENKYIEPSSVDARSVVGVIVLNERYEEIKTIQTRSNDVFVELASYKNFPRDWDGDGSVPPSSNDVDLALELLTAMPSAIPLPKSTISPDGKISLYWNFDDAYAELSIEENETISLYTRDRKSTPVFETFTDAISPFDSKDRWVLPLLELLVDVKMAA